MSSFGPDEFVILGEVKIVAFGKNMRVRYASERVTGFIRVSIKASQTVFESFTVRPKPTPRFKVS